MLESLMQQRFVLQINSVKRSVSAVSIKIADLRAGLRWDEVSIQRAVSSILGRIAGEVPS